MRCKERNIKIIQRAGIKSWTAAAWWLERKHPDEFAQRGKFEHTGKDGAPLIPIVFDKQDAKL
jgi:hypothetical protein